MGSEADKPAYQVIRYRGIELPYQYRNLIISKWQWSLRLGNDYMNLIDSSNYFSQYSRYIKLVIALPETMVRLATLMDDADVVLGFSVISRKTLQYVHVHKDARRQGIARSLIPSDVDSFTHLTQIAMKLWSTKMPNAKFIIYSPENEK